MSASETLVRFAVIAAMNLWLASAALPSARADVVLGNLGANGTGALTTTNFQVVTPFTTNQFINTKNFAMGFKTSNVESEYNSFKDLQSVTLGLSSTGTGANTTRSKIAVGIFANTVVSGSNIPGSLLAQSQFTNPVTGTTPTLHTFTFTTPYTLAQNTSYWVIPVVERDISFVDPDFRWYRDSGQTNPAPYSNSGFSYSQTLKQSGNNAWSLNNVSGSNRSYSLSIVAVPEPSTMLLAGISLVVVGGAVWRSRKRRGFDAVEGVGQAMRASRTPGHVPARAKT